MRWIRRGGAGLLLAALAVGAWPEPAAPATRQEADAQDRELQLTLF